MKTRVYNNNDSYILPDDIGLSENLLNAFKAKDGDFVDVKIDDGKMIISRRKVRCKVSNKEFDDAMETAMDIVLGCSYNRLQDALEVIFNELDIKVED